MCHRALLFYTLVSPVVALDDMFLYFLEHIDYDFQSAAEKSEQQIQPSQHFE